jgi:CpXC protein
MSIFFTASAECPECGASATLDYPASVNADRRPDLREAILDQSLFTLPCPSCAKPLTFDPHISYLDVARRQWILAESVDQIENWRGIETDACATYDLAFGAGAPAVAREIGARLLPRLVFGWPALIEKLLCQTLGLDDVAVETLKLALLRASAGRTLDTSLELRLVGQDDDALTFAWLEPVSGLEHERVRVPRDAYVLVKGDLVTGDGAAWGPVAALLAGRMFVDVNRVLRGPDGAAPAHQTAI